MLRRLFGHLIVVGDQAHHHTIICKLYDIGGAGSGHTVKGIEHWTGLCRRPLLRRVRAYFCFWEGYGPSTSAMKCYTFLSVSCRQCCFLWCGMLGLGWVINIRIRDSNQPDKLIRKCVSVMGEGLTLWGCRLFSTTQTTRLWLLRKAAAVMQDWEVPWIFNPWCYDIMWFLFFLIALRKDLFYFVFLFNYLIVVCIFV